ncbi:Protein of unknown function [Halogranum gelatinilyticum]|uniref:Antitoxin SocA-like Panacea domain-containing protein n=1 Tax=Halogranum gelatinilyticum TaxID=660521 RepID=A0A1G9TSF1_9EURY|nr:type II toxin-antitoxin system antitoxin SocA domain-containing protein [Halogranum gelatinilyticum]SDM50627.1 Protein of unknown function [Halogranum gelatinilyticum]
MANIDDIDRREDVAFLLFRYADEIEGTTRLQKLLFLIEHESEFSNLYEDITFEFESYHYGPFSEGAFDALEFLISLGAIEEIESDEDYDYIRDSEDRSNHAGKKFVITEKGRKISQELDAVLDPETKEDLETLVEKYNDLELDDLLEYVYEQYPEYTDKSKIKEDVLG